MRGIFAGAIDSAFKEIESTSPCLSKKIDALLFEGRPNISRGFVDESSWSNQIFGNYFRSALRHCIICFHLWENIQSGVLSEEAYSDHGREINICWFFMHSSRECMIHDLYNLKKSFSLLKITPKAADTIFHEIFPNFDEARHSLAHQHERDIGMEWGRAIPGLEFGQMLAGSGTKHKFMDRTGQELVFEFSTTDFKRLVERLGTLQRC